MTDTDQPPPCSFDLALLLAAHLLDALPCRMLQHRENGRWKAWTTEVVDRLRDLRNILANQRHSSDLMNAHNRDAT